MNLQNSIKNMNFLPFNSDKYEEALRIIEDLLESAEMAQPGQRA